MRAITLRNAAALTAIVAAMLFASPTPGYAQAPYKGWGFTYWYEAAHINFAGYWEKDCASQDVEKYGDITQYWTGQDIWHCN
jgi:hypothetical protein